MDGSGREVTCVSVGMDRESPRVSDHRLPTEHDNSHTSVRVCGLEKRTCEERPPSVDTSSQSSLGLRWTSRVESRLLSRQV